MAWLGTWAKRVKLTIDNTDIDANLTDFPILIYISISSGRNSDDISFVFDELTDDANRKKIAVTKDDGTTQLYVEIVKWDDGGEQAWLWVKVAGADAISSSSDTDLYLYYDSAQADNDTYVGDPNDAVAENVWDSYYKLATHLRDDPDSSHVRDSTAEDADGTKKGAGEPTLTTGTPGGEGQDFSGTGEYISMGDHASLDIGLNDITLEALIKYTGDQSADYAAIMGKGYLSGNPGYGLYVLNSDDKVCMQIRTAGTGIQVFSNNALNDNAEHWIMGVCDRDSATGLKIYVDGAVQTDIGDPTAISEDDLDSSIYFALGARDSTGGPSWSLFYTGLIDEARVSVGIARSAAWAKAGSETAIDNLLDFGSEELISGGGTTYEDTLTDGILLGDSLLNIGEFGLSQTDGIKFGDVLTSAGPYVIALTDGMKLGEVLLNNMEFNSALTDGIKFGELLAVIQEMNLILLDGMKFGDTLSVLKEMNVSLADGVKFGDLLKSAGPYVVTLTDGMKFGDSATVVGEFNIALSDGIRFGDTLEVVYVNTTGALFKFKAKNKDYYIVLSKRPFHFEADDRDFYFE